MDDSRLRPLGNSVLLEKLPEQEMEGGVFVVANDPSLARGRVIGIAPDVFPGVPETGRPIALGDIVLYHKNADTKTDIASDRVIVPVPAIVATEYPSAGHTAATSESFFQVGSWQDFKKGLPAEKIWKQWENIREFKFDIGFMEPACSLEPLKKTIYEAACEVLGSHVSDNMDPFTYSTGMAAKEVTGGDEQSVTLVKCDDDYYDGAIFLAEKSRLLGFRKRKTRLKCLVETVPLWMKVIHRIVTSPAFIAAARPDYSRLLFVDSGFEQVIRLEGKGLDEDLVRNSELMGHFLKFGIEEGDQVSPTIAKLGMAEPLADTIGRVDLKFSFKRKIGKIPCLVWLTVKAPTNEDSSIVHVDWDIQHYRPGDVSVQEYGEILGGFFKTTVLGEFYKTWFKNIKCTSLI